MSGHLLPVGGAVFMSNALVECAKARQMALCNSGISFALV